MTDDTVLFHNTKTHSASYKYWHYIPYTTVGSRYSTCYILHIVLHAFWVMSSDWFPSRDEVAICSFFIRGLCTKGSECVFRHEESIVLDTYLKTKKRKTEKVKSLSMNVDPIKPDPRGLIKRDNDLNAADKRFKCRDCNADFIFIVKYQLFYTMKGYDNPGISFFFHRRI